MTKHSGRSRKYLSMFSLLLLMATCILVLPTQTKAQTSFAGFNYLLQKKAANQAQVSFTYSPAHPEAGQLVQFAGSSNTALTSWSWNFGDGTTSTAQNPSHTFTVSGFYRVTLSGGGSSRSKSVSKTISVMGVSQKTSTMMATPPVASFTFSPTSPVAGQAVQFTDTSTGSPTSWQWNFGDLTTSAAQNPTHTFNGGGSYGVTLTVTNSTGSKSATSTVTVTASLSAGFSFSPSSPVVGQSLQFTDTSTGNPTSWQWSFGDGSTSTTKNPTHAYVSAASYSVTLNVANGSGSKGETQIVKVLSSSNSTYYAASPALADIQAAIAAANSGDTVIVPAGSATWSNYLEITKGIILKGAGVGSTVITSAYVQPNSNQFTSSNFLVSYVPSSPANNDPFRITGFTFNCNSLCQGLLLTNLSTTYPISRVRIDHNEWDNMPIDSQRQCENALGVYGAVYGVYDHNTVSQGKFHITGIDNNGVGQSSWQSIGYYPGTANIWYFEDNNIDVYCWDFFYIEYGGFCVIRHNTFTVNPNWTQGIWPLVDIHGGWVTTSHGYPAMGAEVYNNAINSGALQLCFVEHRSGLAPVFNNAITTTVPSKVLLEIYDEYNCSSLSPSQNLVTEEQFYPYGGYYFNNTINGSTILNNSQFPYVGETVTYPAPLGVVPMEDVQFFRHKSPFDGSSGCGVGTLANRPASCTLTGAGYWATDTNTLYVWSGSAWTSYYTPYTYPHPLQNDSVLGH